LRKRPTSPYHILRETTHRIERIAYTDDFAAGESELVAIQGNGCSGFIPDV